MRLDRLHRRLVIAMGGVSLLAFASGAGVEPISAALAFTGLGVAFFWSPSPEASRRISRLWGPLAFLLTANIAVSVAMGGRDVVVPVVGLLLLLLVSEALRPEETLNESRLYALTMALLLAATAYRPGALFGVAFAGYVVLASVTVPLGLVRRKVQRFGGEAAPPDRRILLTTLALSGVTLLSAAVVFLTFPRVTQGWSGRGDVMATSIAGFSDQISIGEVGARIYSNPQVVLRVEFPDGLPGSFLTLHWRGRSYDRFDGTRWTRSEDVRPSRVPDNWYAERWPPEVVRQEIYAAPLDVRVLFGVGPVVGVRPGSEIYPMFDNVGDWSYWGAATPVYTALSKASPPPPDLLRAAERGYMPDRERYLQLPRLPDRIGALADSVVRAAGAGNRYDRAAALERYLRTAFAYTRELPRTAGEATLDHFLFQRREGHCEYFSTAMVVMLRSLGIHARNVNGFLGGRWNEFGQDLAVTQNEAHSWVEVWFPNYGWVAFDPTPGGASGGEAQAGWIWPGRFWFDGLQHRWNKWILDYSLDSQIDILERFNRWMDRASGAGSADGRPGVPPWIWAMVGLPLLLAALLRRGPLASPSPGGVARGYLSLVRTARRAGILEPGPVTPLRFVRDLRERRPDAGEAASRAVDLYTRARFGDHPL
ncbi:MAG TPA: transglutaminaseTgpA domain-containing protein, partial [Longimicrobiales bacterium]|nr:transglutaminaseTgpA domain-containing protein [Longimicrobiales bacterium]